MTDYNYKIGDLVKIIKPKTHICLGNVGKILKINKTSFIISGDMVNCKNASVTINKKYVEFQERIPLTIGKNIDIFLKSRNTSRSITNIKKRGLDYYMKKAFPLKDFGEFVLFHYMRPGEANVTNGIRKDKLTKKDILDRKLKDKKMVGSTRTPCVFFTAIPTKFFKKYFSETLITNYQNLEKDTFISLDSKIICNMSNKYWIGANNDWRGGPTVLSNINPHHKIFYALDKCDNKLEMTKSFLDFYIEIIILKLETSYLGILQEEDAGIYLKDLDEDKFIHFLRKIASKVFIEVELFVCNADWLESTKTVLRFKKEDVLIANYEKDVVEENIKRVLKM
jgi:hypothetical protein